MHTSSVHVQCDWGASSGDHHMWYIHVYHSIYNIYIYIYTRMYYLNTVVHFLHDGFHFLLMHIRCTMLVYCYIVDKAWCHGVS